MDSNPAEGDGAHSYDERFFPARLRPRRPVARERLRGLDSLSDETTSQPATSENPEYVEWLVGQSMLQYAKNDRPPALRHRDHVAEPVRTA